MRPIRHLSGILAYPRLLAPVAGAVAACGFQPLALWPVTIVAVALLIALIAQARTGSRAALLGWLFGVGHFTIGNNWIATAFTYQANMPAWLGWIAVVLLALYLAVYPALATGTAWLLARTVARRRGEDGVAGIGALLVPCWIIAEWLRATVFTGFAWNPLGVALLGGYQAPGLAALTPYIGSYGLSGVLVALAALLHAGWRGEPRLRQAALLGAGIAMLVLAMHLPVRHATDAGGSLRFTVVQPDFRQEELDDPRFYEAQFRRIAALSAPRDPGERRLVLWPESGVPDYLRGGYPTGYYRATTYAADPAAARARIAGAIGPGSLLLTGAVDLALKPDGGVSAARNVVTALDGRGEIVGSYAKAHLVPYGEYLALRWLLEPLGATRLVPGSVDFQPGPGPRTLDLGPWGRTGVQICYEITFSGEVADTAHRPDYLFNPSNDGWFGAWGPPQHLAQARLRAIEEGLPVLRATTTGISAVIDAHGIVRQHLPRLVAGRLDGVVPPALSPTPFARAGNALPLGIAALLLGITAVALLRRRR